MTFEQDSLLRLKEQVELNQKTLSLLVDIVERADADLTRLTKLCQESSELDLKFGRAFLALTARVTALEAKQ